MDDQEYLDTLKVPLDTLKMSIDYSYLNECITRHVLPLQELYDTLIYRYYN